MSECGVVLLHNLGTIVVHFLTTAFFLYFGCCPGAIRWKEDLDDAERDSFKQRSAEAMKEYKVRDYLLAMKVGCC